jgi:hypothetical protein
MAFSLEENMIQVLKNCIKTSSNRTHEHERIDAGGWMSWSLFSKEAWMIRMRNEAVSREKREILAGLIEQLKGSHGFHLAQGGILNDSFPDNKKNNKPKGLTEIASEINIQISQFHGLQVILREHTHRIQSTVSLTSAGGESLIAVQACKTILDAAILVWILKLQQHGFHKNGVFPIKFGDSAIDSDGKLFEQYVRDLINTKKQIPTTQLFDPSSKQNLTFSQTDMRASGVFELASLRGAPPVGASPIPKVMKDMETQTVDVPSAPPAPLSTMVGAPVLLGQRPGYAPPPPPRGNPPPYDEHQYDHLATVFEEGPQPQYYIDPEQVQKPVDPNTANTSKTNGNKFN